MASIGTLSIDFAASVARLEKDVRGASKAVQQVAGEIDKATTTARNAIMAMAGALGVTSFAAAIRDAGNAADAAAKMGDRFGIATEQMVGLQHAADLSGLANVENALKTMTEKVGEAATKSGEARDAMRLLGVSASDLSQLPVTEQFNRMVAALGDVENVTQRNYIAQKLFSESAGGVLRMVADGADGIAQATRDTEAWGTALSRVDAAKIEMANDATTRAQSAMRGIFTTISVQVAPIIKTLADQFANTAAQSKGFKDEAVSGAGFVATAIAYTSNVVQGLRLVWAGAKVAVGAFFNAIIQGVASADRFLTDWQNKLAGSWIGEKLGIARAQYSESLQLMSEVSRERLGELMADVGAIVDAGLPADAILAKITAIRAQMDKEAAEIAKRRQELGRTEGVAGITEDTSKADADAAKKAAADDARWQQDLARKLERIQLANLSEAEVLNAKRLEEQNTLDLALGQKLLSEDQHRQMSLQAEMQHQAALGNVWAQGLVERERFAKLTTTQQTQHVLGSLLQMTQGVASSNRAMFNINKAAAIGTAIINTYQGATKALAQGGFFGIFMMAATLAAGLAQVQQIRSQQFGAASSSVSAAAAPSAAVTESSSAFQTGAPGGAMAPGNVADRANTTAQRNVYISLSGDGVVSTSWVRDTLIPEINRAIGDGVTLSPA